VRLLDIHPEGSAVTVFMRGIGWFPGRTESIQEELEAWSNHGYNPSSRVLDFMVECSGLEFEHPKNPSVGGVYSCWISASASSVRIFRSLVSDYESRVGLDMCPIGQSSGGAMFLFMSSDGAVYGGRDRFLAKISNDGYGALLSIYERDRMVNLL
jgi:hypothetical protein